MLRFVILLFPVIVLFNSCEDKPAGVSGSIHFTSIPSSTTNIRFNNIITESDSINLIVNAYSYMGSGVGVGDFNNDGMPDVFLGANQTSSKLYMNKGNMVFEDITAKAGLSTSSWVTGVSIIDINSDGYDDIYLCVSATPDASERINKLYINNQDLTFTERAAEYGLNDSSYSTQAAFVDYDKDGDLDMYLVNNSFNHSITNNIVPKNLSGNAPAQDRLYRNMGVRAGSKHPYFEDVTKQAGIMEDGYGLGVAITDIDNDGWPDIYISNDYLANDLLWLNNRNGTFSNALPRSAKHQSYSSMGLDANDINNDGLTDIITLDMIPEPNYRNKMMFTFMNYERYMLERKAGYEPQFIRNMLQINNGSRLIRDTLVPFFSEVGQLAGISETDWSWSVLMADLNNDGLKDIHITNGYGRDIINSDFIFYAASLGQASNYQARAKQVKKKLDEYGIIELSDYCYQNNGDLSFTDVSKASGIATPSISNGCVYADLDNDGDLDLVVNNINKEAFIFQNEARKSSLDTVNNFLSFRVSGDSSHPGGLGCKITVYTGDKMQSAENYPVRGYLSSVDKRLHFGIGNAKSADSVRIIWPDGSEELMKSLAANSFVEVGKKSSQKKTTTPQSDIQTLFADITDRKGINFKHTEIPFYDYGYQQLLPQKFSQLGPFISVADVNGDKLDDFFVGGAKGQAGKLFVQKANGEFEERELPSEDKIYEDLGSLFFDADGDNDLDLAIISGGNEAKPGSSEYLPRLYLNDGKGNFRLSGEAFPKSINTSAQCIAGADYDNDGDIDLFIGGRLFPRQFPVIPESYLLENNGGRFTVVTKKVCPPLQYIGMVTDAVWTDFDNDKQVDLIVGGEWMPLRFFRNQNGKLIETTDKTGVGKMFGQWRSLHVADIDNDGDMDIVAGNIGNNNRYKASPEFPIKMFAKDLDGNGSIDPVIAYHRIDDKGERKLYPGITRDQFAAQVPMIKKKFLYNEDYSTSSLDAILSGASREDMIELSCNHTSSVWLENKGDWKFEVHSLPVEAQLAPVNSIVTLDADHDGVLDILLAGNEYQAEVMLGRHDASYGLMLKGKGRGIFEPVKPVRSGFIIDGDVRSLKQLTTANGERIILAAVNDELLRVFRIR